MVHAAAGGAQPALLKANFVIQAHQTSTPAWVAAVPAPSSAGTATDGQEVSASVATPLSDGTLYRMAASTWSYTSDGTQHVSSPSTATTAGWCYFTVDTTAPLAPTVTFGGPYTPCGADDCAAHGGPGVPGTFTFSPGAGDSGVVAYEYWLAGSATVEVPGSPATVTIAPSSEGTAALTVRAQDATGAWGAQTQVLFRVAPPAPSVGLWHFDDGRPGDTSTVAADTATGAGDRHAAALSATGADWSAQGRRGDGDESLALDGTSGHAATDSQVLDPASSFAVSAWVFPFDLTQDRTVLSQTGDDGSGFALSYAAADHAWQFTYAWHDTGGTRHVAYARATAGAERVWTQLAGSYDSVAHTLTLYMNGRPQGSPTTLPATAAAQAISGDVEFGRGTVGGAAGSYGAYWHGLLDEVRVWQRTLSAADAVQEARLEDPATGAVDVARVAAWNAAGASGTTLPDTTTGYGRTLTTEGGALLDGDSLVLDGVDDAAGTPGPVVDDSGSFTVSVVAQPDLSVIAGKPDGWMGQVAGQSSADGSAWGIWYQVVGHEDFPDPDSDGTLSVPVTTWLLGRMGNDGAFTGVRSQDVTEWTPGSVSLPVRVTGVLDAQAGTASLFTGAARTGGGPFTPVPGAGDLIVGKAHVNGAWTAYFPGRVTSLDVWAGAMSDTRIPSA
ncbi:laminin G domain-containing protein [Actinacidiphila rubida]|uniref:LamG domain-containing protein n=1 Tax=Actinacidiphila rubida TaxID=310780 RepID=UPI000849B130|nr:LamG domain-containing protein [Actinacidiphila rubida]